MWLRCLNPRLGNRPMGVPRPAINLWSFCRNICSPLGRSALTRPELNGIGDRRNPFFNGESLLACARGSQWMKRQSLWANEWANVGRWLTLDDVTVLPDDSDSFDSDPGEWLRFLRPLRPRRPFHFGAAIKTKKNQFAADFLFVSFERRTTDVSEWADSNFTNNLHNFNLFKFGASSDYFKIIQLNLTIFELFCSASSGWTRNGRRAEPSGASGGQVAN